MLNKRERNRLFQVIEEEKFDPADFDLEDQDDKVTVTHNSGSTFEYLTKRQDQKLIDFGLKEITYEYRFSVVEGNSKAGSATSVDFISKYYIPDWLKEIRLTVGVPDYWTELQRNRKSLAIIQRGDFGNTPFTQAEQEQIAAQLQEIKKQIKEQFALSNEQMERIEERLDEAAEASKRMGRKDWLLLFSGIIFTLIIAGTVTPDVADHIFTAAINGLIHLFTGGSEPPRILT